MKRPHYAWIICLVCLLLFICNMGLCSNILAAYLPFIEAAGISERAGSAILSVRCLFSFLAMFFVGVLYRRFPVRTGVLIPSFAGILSALVFSAGGSAAVYFAGAALGGIAYGAGSAFPASLLLANWFKSKRGLAVGISAAGSGLATMIFSPVVTAVITKYSLRAAFLTQAAFMAVSCAVCFMLIKDRPEDMGLAPYESERDAKKAEKKPVSRELPSSALWLLGFMMLLNGGASLSFSGHLSVLAKSCGYSTQTAAAVLSSFSLLLVLGKFLSGGLADRLGTKKSSVMLILIFIAGCFAVLRMDGISVFWCYAPALMLGLGASVYNVGPPLWSSDFSPKESYAKTLRWLQMFYNLGGIIFTVVPGFIAQRTGEYKSSYILFGVMMIVSLAILLWTYRFSERRERQGQAL